MALASWGVFASRVSGTSVLPSFARVFAVGREATSMQVHVNEDRLGLGRHPWRLRRLRLLAHFGGPKVGSHAPGRLAICSCPSPGGPGIDSTMQCYGLLPVNFICSNVEDASAFSATA